MASLRRRIFCWLVAWLGVVHTNATLIGLCDFEQSACGFDLEGNWTYGQSGGWFDFTQPVGRKGTFLQLSPDNATDGGAKYVTFDVTNGTTDSMCLSFWFSFYGEGSNSFQVIVASDQNTEVVWSHAAVLHRGWIHAEVLFLPRTTKYKIVLQFTTSADTEHIALDSLRLRSTTCFDEIEGYPDLRMPDIAKGHISTENDGIVYTLFPNVQNTWSSCKRFCEYNAQEMVTERNLASWKETQQTPDARFWIDPSDNAVPVPRRLGTSWIGQCPGWVSDVRWTSCNSRLSCMCQIAAVPVNRNVAKEKSVAATPPTMGHSMDLTDGHLGSESCVTYDASSNDAGFTIDLHDVHNITTVLIHSPELRIPQATPPQDEEEICYDMDDIYFNKAVGKPAYGSSVFGLDGHPFYSNDGMRNGGQHGPFGRCSETMGTEEVDPHWWLVDLQGLYEVHSVMVANRADCCVGWRFHGIEIHATNYSKTEFERWGQFNSTTKYCASHPNLDGGDPLFDDDVTNFRCLKPLIGRYIILLKYPATDWPLHFCELEVYGRKLHEDKAIVTWCPDQLSFLRYGMCYRMIGSLDTSENQRRACQLWDPPYSDLAVMVIEDLVYLLPYQLRLFYGIQRIWVRGNDTTCQILPTHEDNTKRPYHEDCNKKYAALCQTLPKRAYPVPIGAPRIEAKPTSFDGPIKITPSVMPEPKTTTEFHEEPTTEYPTEGFTSEMYSQDMTSADLQGEASTWPYDGTTEGSSGTSATEGSFTVDESSGTSATERAFTVDGSSGTSATKEAFNVDPNYTEEDGQDSNQTDWISDDPTMEPGSMAGDTNGTMDQNTTDDWLGQTTEAPSTTTVVQTTTGTPTATPAATTATPAATTATVTPPKPPPTIRMILFPSMAFKEDGYLYQWEAYSNFYRGFAYLTVWRDTGKAEFENIASIKMFIASPRVQTGGFGVESQIPLIRVKKGDFIGIVSRTVHNISQIIYMSGRNIPSKRCPGRSSIVQALGYENVNRRLQRSGPGIWNMTLSAALRVWSIPSAHDHDYRYESVCKMHNDTTVYIEGDGYYKVPIPRQDDWICGRLCQTDPRCVVSVFHSPSLTCRLFDELTSLNHTTTAYVSRREELTGWLTSIKDCSERGYNPKGMVDSDSVLNNATVELLLPSTSHPGVKCHRTTSMIDHLGNAVYHCRGSGSQVKINLPLPRNVSICEVEAFGFKESAVSSMKKESPMNMKVRQANVGLLRDTAALLDPGIPTCSAMDVENIWVQVDLLGRHNYVTGIMQVKPINWTLPAVSWKMYVTDGIQWRSSLIGYTGEQTPDPSSDDMTVTFPCKKCYGGRFVTITASGADDLKKYMQVCSLEIFVGGAYWKATGIAAGDIPNGHFTSTSTWKTFQPHKARLHFDNEAWCGNVVKEYVPTIQVDLQTEWMLTSFEVQGFNRTGEDNKVSALALHFSKTKDNYTYYHEFDNKPKLFRLSTSPSLNHTASPFRYDLLLPIRARYVKLVPTIYTFNPCLRVEFYGYPVDQNYRKDQLTHRITQPTTISSPEYPSYYGHGKSIRWIVEPPSGKHVRVSFKDVKLANVRIPKGVENVWKVPKACNDQLNIGQPNSLLPPYQVNMTVQYMASAPGPLEISLDSCKITKYVPDVGFQAHVDFDDCAGLHVGAEQCYFSGTPINVMSCGYISSPKYPLSYNLDSLCIWNITTGISRYLELTFQDFDVIGTTPNCDADKVDVFLSGGNTIDETQMMRFCNERPPPKTPLVSKWRTILVRLQVLGTTPGKGFIAHVRSLDTEKVPERMNENVTCPSGWDQFETNCYKVVSVPEPVTWLQGRTHCLRQGPNSDLVSVQSELEAKYIHLSLVSEKWKWDIASRYFYIGLRDGRAYEDKGKSSPLGKEGLYRWTDGSPLSFTDWAPGQPNGSTIEDCSLMHVTDMRVKENWLDVPCAMKMAKHMICKSPGTFIVPPETAIEIVNANTTCDPRNQFVCENGECLHPMYVCDEVKDCRDGSDEKSCDSAGTFLQNSFTCSLNGPRVPISRYCDHKPDCPKGEDEQGCVWPPCLPDEFRCGNDECIPKSLVKDFNNDCLDGRDEHQSHCPGFTCFNGRCLPKHFQCDGNADCSGGFKEDELDCASNVTGRHMCKNHRAFDDENRCLATNDRIGYPETCRDATHLGQCENFQCPDLHFKCQSAYCIPAHRVCDKIQDCPKNDDENGCADFNCPGMYRCRAFDSCVPPSQLCDGTRHCPHGDDEVDCWSCPDECTCFGRSLDCSNKKLTKLTSVPRQARKIIFSENELDFNETELNFPLLGELILDRNGLTELASGIFSGLQNLYLLDLRENLLKVLPEGFLNGLHRLRFLYLTGNPIGTISVGAFNVDTNKPLLVQSLDLSGSNLTKLGPDIFTGLAYLRTLDLSSNGLTDIDPDAFKHLPRLTSLDISNNSISQSSRTMFIDLLTVEYLKTDHFKFCCMAPWVNEENCFPKKDAFSSCTDLIRLDVLRIFLWILGTLSLLGNFFVIILRLFEKAKTSTNKIIIESLAVSDFLMGVYLYIIAVADISFRGFYIENDESWRYGPLCNFAGFLSTVSSEVSVFMLVIMSIDRFMVVVFPFSKFRVNVKRAKLFVIISWVVGFVLGAVPIIPSGYFQGEYYSRSGVCLSIHLTSEPRAGYEYSVFVFLVLNLVAFLVIAFFYTWMYIAIKQMADMMKGKTGQKEQNKELVVARKMALIILTDFCCWMPIIVLGLAALSGKVTIPGDVYAWIAIFVLPINSAINPFLYTLSTIQIFRKERKLKKVEEMSKTSGMTVQSVVEMEGAPSLITYNPDSHAFPYIIKGSFRSLANVCNGLRPRDLLVIARDVTKAMVEIEGDGLSCPVVDEKSILLHYEKDKNTVKKAMFSGGNSLKNHGKVGKDVVPMLGEFIGSLVKRRAA